MQGKRIAGGIGAALAVAAFAAPAQALAPEEGVGDPGGLPARMPDQVIVQFEPGASPAERADARDEAGAETLEGLGSPGLKLVEIVDGGSIAATIRELESDPAVESAEPNGIDRPLALPNDPAVPQLWGLENFGQTVDGVASTPDADIDASAAWDITTGSPNTIVAIMDSGADLTHPDLAPQLWQNPGETSNGADDNGNGIVDDVSGADFFDNDGNPTDTDSGHGTHVAGTALARGNDGFGVTGVSQQATLMVLRVCGFIPSASDPPGDVGCPQSDQIEAINYAAANGARVLNGSLGGAGGSESTTRRNAIYSHPEVLYVFAAGNGGADSVGDNNDVVAQFPCAHAQPSPPVVPNQVDNILCVAATNQADGRAAFSNFGATTVDLGAPGFNTFSDSGEKSRLVDNFETAPLAWGQSAHRVGSARTRRR